MKKCMLIFLGVLLIAGCIACSDDDSGSTGSSGDTGSTGVSGPVTLSSSSIIQEGQEDGSSISVTLQNSVFAASLNPANWSVSNLPSGVAVLNYSRISDTQVDILLQGNRDTDYDADITNVVVYCSSNEITGTSATNLSVTDNIVFQCKNPSVTIVDASHTHSYTNGNGTAYFTFRLNAQQCSEPIVTGFFLWRVGSWHCYQDNAQLYADTNDNGIADPYEQITTGDYKYSKFSDNTNCQFTNIVLQPETLNTDFILVGDTVVHGGSSVQLELRAQGNWTTTDSIEGVSNTGIIDGKVYQ